MTGWRNRVNELRMMHKTGCNNRPHPRLGVAGLNFPGFADTPKAR